jgi:hypothetical protein
MPLYVMDGWSREIVARRLRAARAEWALRIWIVIAWAAAIALVGWWLAWAERRSAAGDDVRVQTGAGGPGAPLDR